LQSLGLGLKNVWAAWTRLMHIIANFQARVLLTLIYSILVLPFGLAIRLFADPLRIKTRPSQWLDHPDEVQDMQWARRQ